MSIKRLLSLSGVALACAGLLGGCATQKQQPQWAFDDDSIRSVLVFPSSLKARRSAPIS